MSASEKADRAWAMAWYFSDEGDVNALAAKLQAVRREAFKRTREAFIRECGMYGNAAAEKVKDYGEDLDRGRAFASNHLADRVRALTYEQVMEGK